MSIINDVILFVFSSWWNISSLDVEDNISNMQHPQEEIKLRAVQPLQGSAKRLVKAALQVAANKREKRDSRMSF
ncbi:hypothetical protein MKW98_030611 [Papaver atlanticum]|uniref:Uncharacterized protein n=1 Tax=Papaver atlanticum TaxID=357466 RepID=A0AAD4SJU4_9MAGN|nr:hypothetical protein MKW98_030611 [Papaver atlanticum]